MPRLFVATIAVLFAMPMLGRADPTGEALRLVPPDVSLCFVVRDLRTHLKAIGESPFAAWLEETPLGKQLADPKEIAKIRALEQFLTEQFGVTGEQLVDDILGDAIVFAYKAGPPDRPQEEAGLLIINARKPDALAKIVTRLNELQQKSGEITSVTEKSHRDRPYFERKKADGGREFYFLRGGLLAYSGQEGAIHQAIEQDRIAPPADKPGQIATSLAALGMGDKFAVCWFNPRGLDAELKTKAETSKDAHEKAFLAQFKHVWAATDAVAFYGHPGRGLEFGMVAAIAREKLPKEIQPVLFPPAGASAALAAAPKNAIAVIGGRTNAKLWLDAIATFLPDEGKTALKTAIEQGLGPVVGRDKLPAVLAGLGPDWAAWVSPPDAASGTWVPEWTAAIKLTPQDGADVPKIILQAVDVAAQLARLAHNRDHDPDDQIEITDETRDGHAVKSLTNPKGFPPGFQPSFGISRGYLVIASSPEAVRRFVPGTPTDSPVVRLSAKELRAYLEKHGPAFAEFVARAGKRPLEEVKKEMATVAAALEVFDQIEFRHSAANDRIKMSVHIEFAKSLRK